MRCKICQNEAGNTVYDVREMMFGLRERFSYGLCAACGCLQLLDIPGDPARYYPREYYSFAKNDILDKAWRDRAVVRFLRRCRSSYLLTGKGAVGALMSRCNPAPEKLAAYLKLLRRCQARLDSRILDVGCGSGRMAAELAWYGFTRVTGIDPYLPSESAVPRGVRLLKQDFLGLEGQYDVIMFNHSFEHMDDPRSVLRQVQKLLRPGSWCAIRIPVASSFAWQRYRQNWVQIDAPRHLFLHSLQSMGELAAQAGLSIADVVFDSTEFQFWGSLQYEKDIPLTDRRSYAVDPAASIFSGKDIADFKSSAEALNAKHQGDQACFFIQKPQRPESI